MKPEFKLTREEKKTLERRTVIASSRRYRRYKNEKLEALIEQENAIWNSDKNCFPVTQRRSKIVGVFLRIDP